MSKGSNRRPKNITEKQFEENWEKIFARKKTPKHGRTKVHRDKTKYTRKMKHDAEVRTQIQCMNYSDVFPVFSFFEFRRVMFVHTQTL